METPTKWSSRDAIPALLLLLLFAVPMMIAPFTSLDPIQAGFLHLGLQIAVVVAVCVAYRDMLAEHWREYKKKWGLKLLFALLTAIAMALILQAVRLLPFLTNPGAQAGGETVLNDAIEGGNEPAQPGFAVSLLLAFIPVLAPFLEETLFRHVLCFKFRNNLALCCIMCAVSAVLFGLIHFKNFGGNLLLTIPYMAVGLFLNGVYLFSRNLWSTILPHLLFNAMNSLVPVVFLQLLPLLGGVGG